jgi:hypothetical protein
MGAGRLCVTAVAWGQLSLEKQFVRAKDLTRVGKGNTAAQQTMNLSSLLYPGLP